MTTYQTRQRKILLEFLSNNAHKVYSVQEIKGSIQDSKISLSSIYRNLLELESLGAIRRVSKSGAREGYYQYVDSETCKNKIHLHCEQCETSYHIEGTLMEAIVSQIRDREDFEVDKGNTVINGVCKNCSNNHTKDNDKL